MSTKRISLFTLKVALVLACSPVFADSTNPADPAADTAAKTGTVARAPLAPSGIHCLRETGSLIRPGASGCLEGVHGTTVEREEFEQRSGFTTGDFLKYDPALNVH
jgi:hypothetical protein